MKAPKEAYYPFEGWVSAISENLFLLIGGDKPHTI